MLQGDLYLYCRDMFPHIAGGISAVLQGHVSTYWRVNFSCIAAKGFHILQGELFPVLQGQVSLYCRVNFTCIAASSFLI